MLSELLLCSHGKKRGHTVESSCVESDFLLCWEISNFSSIKESFTTPSIRHNEIEWYLIVAIYHYLSVFCRNLYLEISEGYLSFYLEWANFADFDEDYSFKVRFDVQVACAPQFKECMFK